MDYRLGLLGYPVSHSLSPRIQNAALQAAGLEGAYGLFPVEPLDQEGLAKLLSRVRAGEITGLNVTIPHKQNVIPLLDELTPTARAIGAVNVIYLREGRLVGENTDAAGFLADLKKFIGSRERGMEKQALVLGAGGSARAVLHALLQDGWQVTIAARRLEQTQQLADHFAGAQVAELNPTAPHFPLITARLLVNTTPVGMTPNVDQSPLPEGTHLPEDTLIYDLIYNPRETKLVRLARAQGLPATTGLGMLIEQAALGFRLWTGHHLPIEVFRNAVELEN